MTTPTRLAEIAEREAFEAAFPTAAYCWSPTLGQYTNDWHQAKWSGWLARFTAAHARSREDAEIMREAITALEKFASDWQIDDDNEYFKRCTICDEIGPDDVTFKHEPDCIVTKLRTRADELEGRT